MSLTRKQFRRAVCLFSVASLCFVFRASAELQTPLPPEAQQAFDSGMAAAEQQAWDLAIKSFTQAWRAAPTSPSVLFNLGLAHGKAGHELPAIAWLHAYLAAAPQADNAGAVREEIQRLELAVEIKRDKIFQQALAAAENLSHEQIPFFEGGVVTASDYDFAISSIANSQAKAGDIEGALQTVNRNPRSSVEDVRRVWRSYAETMAQAGDLQTAEQALKHTDEIDPYAGAVYFLASAYPPVNDRPVICTPWPPFLDDARAAAEKVQDTTRKESYLKTIAEHEQMIRDRYRQSMQSAPAGIESPELQVWLNLARGLCEDEWFSRYALNLDKEIQRATTEVWGEPLNKPELKEIPGQLGDVGKELGEHLVRTRLLARKLEQGWKPPQP